MSEPVRVVIVDDDALVRAGLTMMLDGTADIIVVGQAGDGGAVPALLDRHGVDIVLMDLRMPGVDGIAATRRVRARPNPPEVIVLTTFDADEHVIRALRAGASGFLLKDTPPARIVEAIRQVHAGDPFLSPAVTRRLMARVMADEGAYERARAALGKLTPRESEVVAAVAAGKSNAEIGAAVGMTLATVKAHLSHIFAKLDVDNRTQIAMLAHDAGLV